MTARVDRRSIARHGINADDVLATIEALGGRQVGVVLEGERRFALQVRFAAEVRNDEAAIARIPVAAAGGRMLPLGELATFDTENSAAQISRERIQRRISVELNVRGRDIASVVADAREAIDEQVQMPPGYTLEWGGQFENLERASARLAIECDTSSIRTSTRGSSSARLLTDANSPRHQRSTMGVSSLT